jgi:REP-associated tyrosine transposase
MTIPLRGQTGKSTYFITSSTSGKKNTFQTDRMAMLLIEVILGYREQNKYLLHEFVIMPNHFHLLITPAEESTLERSIQFVKGGFSHRVRKELGFVGEVWQTSFEDRRVRELADYQGFAEYIQQNPVRAGLVSKPEDYLYGSASGRFKLDEIPQRLKPTAKASSTQA